MEEAPVTISQLDVSNPRVETALPLQRTTLNAVTTECQVKVLSRAPFNACSPLIFIGISTVSRCTYHFVLYFPFYLSVSPVSLLPCRLLDFSLHYFILLFLLLTLTMITWVSNFSKSGVLMLRPSNPRTLQTCTSPPSPWHGPVAVDFSSTLLLTLEDICLIALNIKCVFGLTYLHTTSCFSFLLKSQNFHMRRLSLPPK